MKKTALLLLLSLLGFNALAQGAGDACRDDVRRFCAQANGDQAATDCLLDHQQDVSDACYSDLKQRLQAPAPDQGSRPAAGVGQACKQDTHKFCSGVQPGGGRIINCLKEHQNDVSDACYTALSKSRQGGRGAASPAADAAARYKQDQQLCSELASADQRLQCLHDAKDAYMRAASAPSSACNSCGTVVAVQVNEKEGGNNVLGMIAGGVAGAVLGHQVGAGHGKDVATVAGAAGGAYAGNKIAGKMTATKIWDVSVRFEDGSEQTYRFDADPGFAQGDAVKANGNSIVRR